jgi:cell division protein FtsI/penicillin-binding protein 2
MIIKSSSVNYYGSYQLIKKYERNENIRFFHGNNTLTNKLDTIISPKNTNNQKILEDELQKAISKFSAKYGVGIIMNPNTGEVLALASLPSYDPNNYNNYDDNARRNKAIADIYEPGSTFKTITACAAIEENIVNEEDKFNGYGGVFQGNGYVIRDVHGLGVVTFR